MTEEFFDLEARIRNKQEEEKRLLKHLADSTGKLEDILKVESELTRVRGEVEQMQGRLRFLANRADLSTVTITATELKDYSPPSPVTLAAQIQTTLLRLTERPDRIRRVAAPGGDRPRALASLDRDRPVRGLQDVPDILEGPGEIAAPGDAERTRTRHGSSLDAERAGSVSDALQPRPIVRSLSMKRLLIAFGIAACLWAAAITRERTRRRTARAADVGEAQDRASRRRCRSP